MTTLYGTDAPEDIYGTDGQDYIAGYGGDDYIVGYAAYDQLFGGAGSDTIFAGDFDDSVEGGSGDDIIFGGSTDFGNDVIWGDSSADYSLTGYDDIYAGPGNDIVFGGGGKDVIGGGSGNDTLYGGVPGSNASDITTQASGNWGDDQIFGGGGNDDIATTSGNDTVFGGSGDDLLYDTGGFNLLGGGSGNDRIIAYGGGTIYGGSGDDTIETHGGAFTVWGGTGTDIMVNSDSPGSSDVDVFAFTYNSAYYGADSIFGFEFRRGPDRPQLLRQEWRRLRRSHHLGRRARLPHRPVGFDLCGDRRALQRRDRAGLCRRLSERQRHLRLARRASIRTPKGRFNALSLTHRPANRFRFRADAVFRLVL